MPERLKSSHKGDNGHVLVVAGSQWMRGAAVLSARAALQAGAGLVTVASIPCVCDAVAAQLPEAMVVSLPELDGAIAPSAVAELRNHLNRFDSVIAGPGLSTKPGVLDVLQAFFAELSLPCVIDADALNALSMGIQLPQSDCVLTPHPGEMSRLLHSSIAEIQADRFRTVQSAVSAIKQCVLLKGPHSIVGEPCQPLLVNCTGNPGMASAGMGDVLSGIIGALMAQDLPGYYAAACAMFWHGAAGDLCAEEIGPVGYTASQVINNLPRARARIVALCSET
jgi:NAD(P)H-hydrate epimerase